MLRPRKRNNCKRCGELIINRRPHAVYHKDCADEVWKEMRNENNRKERERRKHHG